MATVGGIVTALYALPSKRPLDEYVPYAARMLAHVGADARTPLTVWTDAATLPTLRPLLPPLRGDARVSVLEQADFDACALASDDELREQAQLMRVLGSVSVPLVRLYLQKPWFVLRAAADARGVHGGGDDDDDDAVWVWVDIGAARDPAWEPLLRRFPDGGALSQLRAAHGDALFVQQVEALPTKDFLAGHGGGRLKGPRGYVHTLGAGVMWGTLRAWRAAAATLQRYIAAARPLRDTGPAWGCDETAWYGVWLHGGDGGDDGTAATVALVPTLEHVARHPTLPRNAAWWGALVALSGGSSGAPVGVAPHPNRVLCCVAIEGATVTALGANTPPADCPDTVRAAWEAARRGRAPVFVRVTRADTGCDPAPGGRKHLSMHVRLCDGALVTLTARDGGSVALLPVRDATQGCKRAGCDGTPVRALIN